MGGSSKLGVQVDQPTAQQMDRIRKYQVIKPKEKNQNSVTVVFAWMILPGKRNEANRFLLLRLITINKM